MRNGDDLQADLVAVLELGDRLLRGEHRDHARHDHPVLVRPVHVGEEVVVAPAHASAQLFVGDPAAAHRVGREDDHQIHAELFHPLMQQAGKDRRGQVSRIVHRRRPPTKLGMARLGARRHVRERHGSLERRAGGHVLVEELLAEALPHVGQGCRHELENVAIDIDDGIARARLGSPEGCDALLRSRGRLLASSLDASVCTVQ